MKSPARVAETEVDRVLVFSCVLTRLCTRTIGAGPASTTSFESDVAGSGIMLPVTYRVAAPRVHPGVVDLGVGPSHVGLFVSGSVLPSDPPVHAARSREAPSPGPRATSVVTRAPSSTA